ncbi:hypothetical protein MTO96_003322 [Rhipicephalus appendiculatus]
MMNGRPGRVRLQRHRGSVSTFPAGVHQPRFGSNESTPVFNVTQYGVERSGDKEAPCPPTARLPEHVDTPRRPTANNLLSSFDCRWTLSIFRAY